MLGHRETPCDERYPIIDGVPRLLLGPARWSVVVAHRAWFSRSEYATDLGRWVRPAFGPSEDVDLVQRFDSEWRTFYEVGTREQQVVFKQYFDLVDPALLTSGEIALDAGCGAGRWAYEVARRGARVLAIDLGSSIDVAARNTRAIGRVACIQADIRALPIREGAVTLAYSLGVLHHLDETASAIKEVARTLRPGGTMLVYLYYALAERSPAFRGLFAVTDFTRRMTSRLPQPITGCFATAAAITVYFPLARMSWLLRRLGLERLAAALPLSYYADRSLHTMRNDSLDRFGTRLEKRYTRSDIVELLTTTGLTEVRISSRPPYWHAVARR